MKQERFTDYYTLPIELEEGILRSIGTISYLGNSNGGAWVRSHWQGIALILMAITYGCIWSFIGLTKILALHAYVYDLGISAERGWEILHVNLGAEGYFRTFLNSGVVFPLSPLTGSGNFFAMVTHFLSKA